MKKLYITNNFTPKMAESDTISVIQEIDPEFFKEILINSGTKGFDIMFAIDDTNHIENLMKILDISIDDEQINEESIDSGEVGVGDMVLLAEPVQSCVFRYFVITFHYPKDGAFSNIYILKKQDVTGETQMSKKTTVKTRSQKKIRNQTDHIDDIFSNDNEDYTDNDKNDYPIFEKFRKKKTFNE